MLEIDAIHFAFRQPLAAEIAQKSYLSTYPRSKILCVIDLGGYEYKPNLPSEQLQIVYSNRKISSTNQGTYLRKEDLIFYLEWLVIASNQRENSDWLMILEDDVLIFKPIKQLHFALNGSTAGRMSRNLQWVLAKDKKFLYWSRKFGGCGGSVIHKSVINSRTPNEWFKILEKYFDSNDNHLATDLVLSIMTVLSGGKIGKYEGFMETNYAGCASQLEAGNVVTLHSFKENYQ